MRVKTKKGVIKTAQRAINALKDLHEDATTVNGVRDAARAYLACYDYTKDIERFIEQVKN